VYLTTRIAKFLLLLMLIGSTSACHSQSIQESSPAKTSLVATTPTARKGGETGELTHQGRQRTYYLYTPKTYNPNRPMPLVIALHGYGGQGKDLAANTGFSELAEQKGFIIAYPDGIERRWDVVSNPLFGVDDVSFIAALIDHLTQIRAIDRRRIYATGVSNGGFLVQRLACEQNSQIAAFATVVATLPSQVRSQCHPARPVSLLMINGTADRKVPWNGGNLPYASIVSVPGTLNFWLEHNQCPGQELRQNPNQRVEISRFHNCLGGSEVELVTLKGVGHVWPRGGSGSTQLLNGSQEIWNFFQRHPLR
jgi:polyhydroxybutyrate depolymerase